MKHSTRSAVAAAFAGAVAFGLVAPATSAPPANNGSTHVTANAQAQVVRQIGHKDAALARAVKETRISHLAVIGGADTKAAVVVNVTGDRAGLADLLTQVQSADSALDLRQVRTDLRQVRTENYVLVVNTLRQGATIQTQIDAAGGNAEAATALTSAVEKALVITAASPKSSLQAVRADLAAARAALETPEQPVEGETPTP